MAYKRSRDELEDIQEELQEHPPEAIIGEIIFDLSSDTQTYLEDMIQPPMKVTVADILVSIAEEIEKTEEEN